MPEPIVPLEVIQRRAQESAAAGNCPHATCPWPPESAAAEAFHQQFHEALQERRSAVRQHQEISYEHA